MRKTKRRYGCPVEFSIDRLSGKWKTVILSRLKLRPMRYGELREAIPALSDKILTERLRDLSEAGFVKQVPSRNGDKLPRGGHAGRRVRHGFGQDLEIAEALLQQLADHVVRRAPAARPDCRLHVEPIAQST